MVSPFICINLKFKKLSILRIYYNSEYMVKGYRVIPKKEEVYYESMGVIYEIP
nr:MAG TPA: hypothetical protein [Caudoviricetes sp.]